MIKADTQTILKLMDEYGLNQRQAKFAIYLALNNGNQTQAHKDAGYEAAKDITHTINGSRLSSADNVKGAYISLLGEDLAEKSQKTALTKQKVVDDIELARNIAIDKLKEGKHAAGGVLNALVRASELQGRAAGMFITKHVKHEHEHAVVPTADLLKRLGLSNPSLAASLANHLEVIDAEFEEIPTKEQEEPELIAQDAP